MSEEFLRLRLFRAFATTKMKGIGLGLFTCREIVEAHGGRLDVESKLGAGTRFRVVLPSVPFIQSRDSGGHEQKRQTSAIADGRGA
jgi:signal transduction histidine kinase